MRNPNGYAALSNGAVFAEVEGDASVGKEIALRMYPDTLVGMIINVSRETICLVDEQAMKIGWSRDLPISGKSERYHVLERLGANRTRSYICLTVPGIIGEATTLLFQSTIESAFNDLNRGIANAATSSFAKKSHLTQGE